VEVVYNLRVADWHTYFVGGEDWGFSVWAHNTCDPEICEFRAEHGLDALQPNSTSPIDNQYCSTVAKVVIDDDPVFGVNKDVPNAVAMRPWRLYQGSIRKQLLQRLQLENPGQFNQMPQFLAHAEFTCLYLASAGLTKSLPQHLKMDSDRTLCAFSDGCLKNLSKVLSWFGITELYIRDAHDDVTKFTATESTALQPMTLEQWRAFNP
ncbi:MAG: HINT domain-containing protein, partial [Bacteroidales bacterium]|nr:HINT domain-containing protein [Bacteroidales bacterium]